MNFNAMLRGIDALTDESQMLSVFDTLAALNVTSKDKTFSDKAPKGAAQRDEASSTRPSQTEAAQTEAAPTGTAPRGSNASPERAPSLRMYQDTETGGLVIEKTLYTRYASDLNEGNTSALDDILTGLVRRYKSQSEGPLDRRALANLQHPYGVAPDAEGNRRVVPRRFNGRSVGHAKGLRGSAPTLDVMNRQSNGEDAAANSWSGELVRTGDGVIMRVKNSSPASWFVAHGTETMIAHGPRLHPFEDANGSIRSAWSRTVSSLWRSQEMDDALVRSLRAL